MKVAFRDKLFNLLNEFENENANGDINQLIKTPIRKGEETKSFYSTNSSFNQRVTKKQELSYEQHKISKDHFQEVDKGLSALRQKIAVQTRIELLSPRKPIKQNENSISRNKIQKKLEHLNSDCFYKTSRAFYKNKPIVNFDLAIFSSQSITNSLEMNSPIKKTLMHKSTISDLVNPKRIKLYDGISDLRNKMISFDSISKLKKIENNTKPLSIKEMRKQKEGQDLNQFKNFRKEIYYG